jgi:hypothetical protein
MYLVGQAKYVVIFVGLSDGFRSGLFFGTWNQFATPPHNDGSGVDNSRIKSSSSSVPLASLA